MRRILCMLMAVILMFSLCVGCAEQNKPEGQDSNVVSDSTVTENTEPEPVVPNVYNDGRARPSSCGALQVIDGKLCSESGEPVILRGVSNHGVFTSESFINEKHFEELSRDLGATIYRLALYTEGVGGVGYCVGEHQDRLDQDIYNGVEYAKNQDMYVLIDWHTLRDGDPNTHIEEAKVFFAKMAERFCDYNNVIYEICNEPNGVSWAEVKSYAEVIIPIIREKDPNSVIIVGNPDWSKDLNSVMADPLDFENIMYTFHFYAASHKQEWRDVVEKASQSGLPIFVTEYGVTVSSGLYPVDYDEADIWIDLLEREKISHCMWAFSNMGDPHCTIKRYVLKYNGYTEEDYTETGLWLIDMLKKNNGK